MKSLIIGKCSYVQDIFFFFFLVNIFIQDDMDTCTQHGRVTGVKVAS